MNNLSVNLYKGPSFCSNNLEQMSYHASKINPYWLNNTTTTTNTTKQEEIKPPVTNFVQGPRTLDQINEEAATAATGTAVILRGVQWCIEKLSDTCAKILMRGKEFASADDVKKVANAMKTEKGLQADIHYIDHTNKGTLKRMFPGLANELDVVANGANAFYTDKGKFAVAPKTKPSLILHELGHATNAEKSKFFGAMQKLRVVGMFAPMVLAFLNDITGRRKDGEESFIERHAGKIGFAAFLPTIIEEGAASWRGIQAAKKTLGKNAKLGHLKKNYFFAWMTYVLAGIGVGVASKMAITDAKINATLKNNHKQSQ